MKVIVRLNGVDIEMKGVDIQPIKIELMSIKDLAERLKQLKELPAAAAYGAARFLDDELEEYGLKLSYFEGDGNYCVYLKEGV